MNLKEIKDIIQLMNENDLGEIEVEREGAKLKIKKAGAGEMVSVYRPHEDVRTPPKLVTAIPEQPAQNAKAAAGAGKDIVSPMVGTFYRAPSPESPPFVEVGQMVDIGQVVCIVEAMKLMNEIKSEIRGKITEAAVDNAEPVEFGQVLFRIEPS